MQNCNLHVHLQACVLHSDLNLNLISERILSEFSNLVIPKPDSEFTITFKLKNYYVQKKLKTPSKHFLRLSFNCFIIKSLFNCSANYETITRSAITLAQIHLKKNKVSMKINYNKKKNTYKKIKRYISCSYNFTCRRSWNNLLII